MSSGYFEAMKSAFPPKEEKEPLNEQRLKMTNTIDELMEGKFPGQITIVNTSGTVFTPYFMDSDGMWMGKDLNGDLAGNRADNPNWSIYEEPKKLVKKWLWRYKNANKEWEYNTIYTTEEEANRWFNSYECIKLEYTEIEVEDD